MDYKNKLLASVGACFTSILLIAFALTCIGVIDLKIVGDKKFSFWFEWLGNFAMFMLNTFFMISISMRIFDNRIWRLVCGYVPIYVAGCILGISIGNGLTLLFSTIIPITYVALIAYIKFRPAFNAILIRLCVFFISASAYQHVSGYVKLNSFGFHYYACNIATMFIYSIDLYLFYILMYCVVKKHGSWKAFLRLPRFLKSYSQEILSESRQNKEDVSDLTIRQRHIFCLLAWTYAIIQPIIVLGANALVNKFLHFFGGFYMGAVELIVSWIALELCRLSLGKTFHSKNPIICNVVSLAVFFMISRLGMPLHISLFFNIALVALMAFVIHRFVVGKDELDCLKSYKQSHDEFSLKSCTENALRERCRLHGLSTEDTELSVKLFVDKISADSAAEIYNLEVQSVRNKKYRLSKRLNSMI